MTGSEVFAARPVLLVLACVAYRIPAASASRRACLSDQTEIREVSKEKREKNQKSRKETNKENEPVALTTFNPELESCSPVEV